MTGIAGSRYTLLCIRLHCQLHEVSIEEVEFSLWCGKCEKSWSKVKLYLQHPRNFLNLWIELVLADKTIAREEKANERNKAMVCGCVPRLFFSLAVLDKISRRNVVSPPNSNGPFSIGREGVTWEGHSKTILLSRKLQTAYRLRGLLSNGSHYHRPMTRFIIRKNSMLLKKANRIPIISQFLPRRWDDSNRVKGRCFLLLLRIRSAASQVWSDILKFLKEFCLPIEKVSLRGHATQLSGNRVCCY